MRRMVLIPALFVVAALGLRAQQSTEQRTAGTLSDTPSQVTLPAGNGAQEVRSATAPAIGMQPQVAPSQPSSTGEIRQNAAAELPKKEEPEEE